MKTMEQVYLEALIELENQLARLKEQRKELDYKISTTERMLKELPDIYEQS